MTNNEILMLKIFIVQVTAVILGTMSIGVQQIGCIILIVFARAYTPFGSLARSM
jgi:hypothetical protein